MALVNQGRAAAGEANLNGSTPTGAQQALYSLPETAFNKIASGSNGPGAAAGGNLATGLGSPVANLLVPDLIAYHKPGTASNRSAVAALQSATLAREASTNAFNVFSAFTATGSGSSGALSLDTSIATSLINLPPTVTVTTTSATALGSPFALSIGSFTVHGPAQSLGSIANTPSARVTSTGLVGVTSPSFSTGLASQLPAQFPPRLAESAPSAEEYQAVFAQEDRWNPYADAPLPGRLPRDLLAESVLGDVAANLLLSRGQDGAAPASVPALPPSGARVSRDATGLGSPQDQDVPSDPAAAGLVVFGMAAGLWARRSDILNTRKRQLGRRPR